MSYATQSLLAQDADFINRCNSCASKEIPAGSPTNPLTYVQMNIWKIASAPGFDTAYASALLGGIGRPGWQESVISDDDILAAMQALLAAVPPEPAP